VSTEPSHGHLRHGALLYPTSEILLETVTRFVQDGLARNEPVLIAAPAARLKLIADALDAAPSPVEFVELGRPRNPNLVLPTVLRPFLDRHGDRPTRIVCEQVWPGRLPAEATQSIRCEAVTNWLLAGYPTTLLCLYDAEQLDLGLLRLASRAHPMVLEGGEDRPCQLYALPERVLDGLNDPLPDAGPAGLDVALADRAVAEVGDLISGYGAQLGLPEERVHDLLRALHEVAGPVLSECAEPCRLRLTDDGERLQCELRTPGSCYDPLAGLRPAGQESPIGRAVLHANQLCDLVETHLHTRAWPETAAIHLTVWH
jgi:hypothetical protein